jgi:2-C-methyl-D-erythritol 4-phosphate cytidylyltransferase / 2-C-methyl-D-erythritol 2,4-cyclodiphosphate synthase
MNNYFIILAAGSGKRFGAKKPKQYFLYKNKEIFEHSIEKTIKSKLFKKIILVVDNTKKISKKYEKNVLVIKGGKERSDSSLIALKKIYRYKPSNVLIHDAARPDFSIKLLKDLIRNLKNNTAVVPVIQSKDTIKYKVKNTLYNLDRNNAFLTQTPQAFKYKHLYNLASSQKKHITDEATLFIKNNKKIKFIKGENTNNKITFLEDIKKTINYVGIGFDIHRLIKNRSLYLGGIKIPFHSGLQGHSDGDVILHAIIDALLGAMRKKDIGTYYPSNKNKFKNIRSKKMLKPILDNLNNKEFLINNLDINLICEKPKVSKYRHRIINSIANLMNLNKKKINLKGKTVEKLGLIGKEKAIACEVIISIAKYD